MGAAAFIMMQNNQRRREEEAARRRRMRRREGYAHDHHCEVCHVPVGPKYCFCDEYDIRGEDLIGWPQRCSRHTHWYDRGWGIALIVIGIAVAMVACVIGFLYVVM